MANRIRILILVLFACVALGANAQAAVIWNNGEFDWRHAYSNGMYNSYNIRMYDDFIVPEGGWTIESVWSNNIVMFTNKQHPYQYTQAFWHIVKDLSPTSHTGTTVAGGLIADASVVFNGYYGWNRYQPVYNFGVDIEDIYLEPGHYWLAVTPVGTGPGLTYICSTSWTRMYTTVNVVPEMYGNSYFGGGTGPYYYWIHENSNLWHFGYSMGANGVAGPIDPPDPTVPEPATMALLGLGLAGLMRLRRKKIIRS